MKYMNQMIITDSATIKPSGFGYEPNFYDACNRFFKSASMLPPATSLGLRITFRPNEVPSIMVFSDASLTAEDYKWMFEPCAKIVSETAKDTYDLTETRTYFIAGDDLINTEKSFGSTCLTEELCTLGAALNILVPSCSDRAYVSLEATQNLPLRVLVMLSNSFHGAEILQSESKINELEKGVPCKVASENIKSLLSKIADENDELEKVEMEKDIEDFEIVSIDEDVFAPIEDLDLSVRSYNCLKHAGIHSIAQLRAMDKDKLMKVRNLGRKQIEEVLQKLQEYEHASVQITTIEDEKTGKEMLDELIGLDEVKTQVRRIAALAKMRQDMNENGRTAEPITLNMVFTGNPGTAKTSAARIMAKILYENGILSKPSMIEVGRADIVGRYEGQTASNVQSIFQKAKGGVLFIDEAYSLLEEWKNSYGDEAINTIVQEMENCRTDTVVIFAGYPKPMEEFLSRNPGLRSRVPFHINFADYSVEELTRIAEADAAKRGFSLHPKAKDKITAICSGITKNAENGNGRFCRNLIDKAILSYAERVYGDDNASVEKDYILMPDDFYQEVPLKKEPSRRIGF